MILSLPGGREDLANDGYDGAIRVTFSVPQKSLKGVKIHKLVHRPTIGRSLVSL